MISNKGSIENIGACGMELTKKFSAQTLKEYIEGMANALLIFHRNSRSLQDHDVERENYLWDFVIQAVELDEVKKELLESENEVKT